MTFARTMITACAVLMVLVSGSQIWGGSGISPLPGAVVPSTARQFEGVPILTAPPARISAELAARRADALEADAKYWQEARAALKQLAQEAAALKLELATAREELAALRKAAVAWRARADGIKERQIKSGHLAKHAGRGAPSKALSVPAAAAVAGKARATVEDPAAGATQRAETERLASERLASERLAFAGTAPKSGGAVFRSASPGVPAKRSSSLDVAAPATKTNSAGPTPLVAKPLAVKPLVAKPPSIKLSSPKTPPAMPLAAKPLAAKPLAAKARSAPLAGVKAAAKRAQAAAAVTPPRPDAYPSRAPVRPASASRDAKPSTPPSKPMRAVTLVGAKSAASSPAKAAELPPTAPVPTALVPKAPKTDRVAKPSTKAKPAPQASRHIVASAPPPDRLHLRERKPAPPARSAASLTWELQQELARVGCDPGPIDGKWGRQTRRALVDFAARSKISIATAAPGQDAIDAVSNADARVCPVSCSAGQQVVGGTCIAKRSPPKSQQQARSQPRRQPKARRSSAQSTAGSWLFSGQQSAKDWTKTIWEE